ncbi:dihydroneopterin aldolase [Daejeonella oryzae]|uniref:dihydroneopterin aldolase n=1 Tax=Daejeonella oryzae TaxID=1122943 RepID=UPI0004290ECF|nr:dihydroneopterin aldolase [Daejeonella oryzae]
MGIIQQKVGLHGVRFFSYHGFYPVEQILGSEFILDIETEVEVLTHEKDELNITVNYERLFDIATSEMKIPRKLLETVAHSILGRIRHEFLAVKHIRVCIRKMHPPLSGEVESSVVELKFNR